jgi:rhomboid-like protein
MWPNIPPAAATVLGIIGINAAVWLLWKFPPAWKTLNRYFINVPLLPVPLSMFGNVFSHHQLSHLGINMAMLWFIGTRRERYPLITYLEFS